MFRTILQSILLGTTGVLVFRLAGWHETKDTVLAGSVIAFGLTIVALRGIRADRRESRRTREKGDRRRHWLAVALTILALLTPQAASLTSRTATWANERFRDADRAEFEARWHRLRKEGRWSEIVLLIDERLRRPVSRRWQEALFDGLHEALLSQATSNGEGTEALLQRAKEFAQSRDIPPDLSQGLSDALSLRKLYQSLSGQIATTREEQAASQQRYLVSQRNSAQVLVNLHVQLGDALGHQFDLRRAEYGKARVIAEQHGLDAHGVYQALQRMEIEIAALRPATLDERIRLHALRTELGDVAPVHFLDVALELPLDLPRPLLQMKDITATQHGKPIPVLAFAPLNRSHLRLQAVLLFDISGSMRGDSLTEAKEGARQLTLSLSTSADLTIFAFNDAVVRVLDSKTDARVGFQTMAALQAQGGTALLRALERGLSELPPPPGPRALILLTDGKDSVGGKPVHDLLRIARDQQVVIHSIGLQTSETDFSLLKNLAESTGGTFRTVDRIAELRTHFTAIAATLTQPAYRVVVPATEGTDSVTVCVGTAHRLQFPAPLHAARAAKR